MKTIVVTGGTDGIGRGLALHYLREGARVVAVGSTPEKGAAFLAAAADLGVQDRARFVEVDLTSVDAARKLVEDLENTYASIDALILCAQRYQLFGKRTETSEGHERSLALGYLSRFVLSHGLRDALESTENPVILNVGTPGVGLGKINWDDLELRKGYSGNRATLQAFRANDLLGVAFGKRYAAGRIRFIGYNPGVVSTGMPAALPQPLRLLTKALFKVVAQPVHKALPPMVALIDNPPADSFSAFWQRKPVKLDGKTFDPDAALRLHTATCELIGE
jgi:NAD(P)-dependent dehydrogenase (short-subunit alcohol dehydrogenase family)